MSAEPNVTPASELTTGKPLRVELETAVQWDRESNTLRPVNALRVYATPKAGSRAKPTLLLGPVGVPDAPRASYGDLLRMLAQIIDHCDAGVHAPAPAGLSEGSERS